jgi:glycosyltransferase involved in cell wall biosynthesis
VPLKLLLWRLGGASAACIQATQGQLPGAAICYAHFCHRAYLKRHWHKSSVTGLRRLARLATHRFNAWCEAAALRRARCIVVPSRGLARELAAEYPGCAAKLHVVPNPVAIERFRRPADFDRAAQRALHGCAADDLVVGFMALGDFARKGLGLLLQAVAELEPAARVRLLVIGGQPGEVAEFSALAERLRLGDAVSFVGMQRDVRPFLWACDVFAFPSSYETFGLAVVQAAAAGLPVLACDGLHGIEEFVVDGHNGWSIAREPAALQAWFARLFSERAELPRMAEAALASVQPYDRRHFQARWTRLIRATCRPN